MESSVSRVLNANSTFIFDPSFVTGSDYLPYAFQDIVQDTLYPVVTPLLQHWDIEIYIFRESGYTISLGIHPRIHCILRSRSQYSQDIAGISYTRSAFQLSSLSSPRNIAEYIFLYRNIVRI